MRARRRTGYCRELATLYGRGVGVKAGDEFGGDKVSPVFGRTTGPDLRL